MTRQIKFRAWDKINKKFHIWHPFNSKSEGSDGHIMTLGMEDYDLIYQQFTGLLDKNGKEIYEGDILDDGYNIGVIEFGNQVISHDWNGIGFFLKTREGEIEGFYDKHGKIIGNIYQNPELINQHV